MSDNIIHTENGDPGSRRHFLKVAALTAGSTLLAACGGPSLASQVKIPAEPTLAPNLAQATITASAGKTYFPSGDPNVPDAYTVPPPLVQTVPEPPGRGGTVRVFTITYQPPVMPEAQNAFWQELNRRVNVDFHLLTATSDAYAQKSGSLLASGDLPDIFLMIPSSTPALIPAIQQGAFADLTPYLTGDALQQFPNLAMIPSIVWKGIMVDGRIYGIPRTRLLSNNVLIFRYDWLKKLGASLPKNADDFYRLMVAFTKQNLNGGNSKTKTWGLGRLTETFKFIQQMFRVPNNWRLESDGSLTSYFATDEYKEALAYLIKLYNAGIFHPNALTQNTVQAKNGLIAGQYAGYLDGILGTWGDRTAAKKLNPNSDVAFLVPFAADGGKPISWLGSGNFGFAGFPADAAQDPARLRELLGIMNYFTASQFSVEGDFILNGIDGWDNKKAKNGAKTLTATGQKELQDVWGFGNGVPIWYFSSDPPFGPRMQGLVRQHYKMGIYDPTTGLISPTNTKRGANLNQLQNDYFLRILKGTDPVNAGVDAMYKDWLKNGGAQIRQEFMDQLQRKG
ncbi:MAG TPA: extracellular solute-binding protein [Ktedonobacteraceae bacterium]|nr:extracellular solute-binding protein [Ktedonobacteraceae bacterium]